MAFFFFFNFDKNFTFRHGLWHGHIWHTLVIFDILRVSILTLMAVSYELPHYKGRCFRWDLKSHCLLSQVRIGLNQKNLRLLKHLVGRIASVSFLCPLALRSFQSRSVPLIHCMVFWEEGSCRGLQCFPVLEVSSCREVATLNSNWQNPPPPPPSVKFP